MKSFYIQHIQHTIGTNTGDEHGQMHAPKLHMYVQLERKQNTYPCSLVQN